MPMRRRPAIRQTSCRRSTWAGATFLTDPRLQRLVEIALGEQPRPAGRSVERGADAGPIPDPACRAVSAGQWLRRFVVDAHARRRSPPAARRPSRMTTLSVRPLPGRSTFFGRLRSLNDQALQAVLRHGRRHARPSRSCSCRRFADQYLRHACIRRTAGRHAAHASRTAQDSYKLTLLQFQTGNRKPSCRCARRKRSWSRRRPTMPRNSEGAPRQRTAWCCCSAQPLPADLPPAGWLSAGRRCSPTSRPACRRTCWARRPDGHAGRGAAARRERQHRRCASGVSFPTISLTGKPGHCECRTRRPVSRAASAAWSFSAFHHGADLRGRQAGRRTSTWQTLQKDINVAQYEKAIQTAFSEVANGLAARGNLQRRGSRREKRVAEAEQAHAWTCRNLQFRNGVASYLSRF